jgi:hypothetical protein
MGDEAMAGDTLQQRIERYRRKRETALDVIANCPKAIVSAERVLADCDAELKRLYTMMAQGRE